MIFRINRRWIIKSANILKINPGKSPIIIYIIRRTFSAMKNILLFVALFTALCLPEKNFAQVKGATPISNGQSQVTGTTRAVVIGISDYQRIPDLQYADRDAIAFANWLQSPSGGNLPPENIQLLTNEQATSGQMGAAIEGLLEVCKEDDKAIIYFSGHGDVENKTMFNRGYLLAYDSPPVSYYAVRFRWVFYRTLFQLYPKETKRRSSSLPTHAGLVNWRAMKSRATKSLPSTWQKKSATKSKSSPANPTNTASKVSSGAGAGAFFPITW